VSDLSVAGAGTVTTRSRNGVATADDIPEFERLGVMIESDEEPVEYALDGLLPLGGTAVLVGRPKGGKSTLALNLALAVSRGEKFLGRDTRKGRVLYVALEGAPRAWKELARNLRVAQSDDLYFWSGRAPDAAMAWLHREVKKHEPVLVIVDTMQRLLRVKDGNDYATASNVTDVLIELARLTNAALLMLHHSGRNPSSEIVDAPMGSTAWSAAFDTILVLRKSERYRTLASEGRTGESFPETIIEMEPDTRRVTAAGTKAAVAEADVRAAVLRFLEQYQEAHPDRPFADEPAIVDGVEGRTQAKREALRQLVASREIERTGVGKKGSPYGYRRSRFLVPSQVAEQENEEPGLDEKDPKIEPNPRSRDHVVANAAANLQDEGKPSRVPTSFHLRASNWADSG
jgi:hypothetical protein